MGKLTLAEVFGPAPEPVTELGRYRVLAPIAGVKVSPLALGGMSLGEAWKEGMGSLNKDDAFKLLDAYYFAGGNFIDTSNNYQDEESELWIGEWAASRGIRDNLVIATKFSSDYKSYELGKGIPNFLGNNKKSIHMSVRDSLKKLKTDYIDILYLHWWDYTTTVKEIMDSLHILVEQGKVLYLGISDTPAWIVSQANQYAVDHGKTPFVVYQGKWSLKDRDFEREIIPMARQWGMALCPWDVLGGGKFQTKAAMEERQQAGEGLRNLMQPSVKGTQTDEEAKLSEALQKVAAEHGIESVTAVALAYVIAKASHVIPLVGGRKVEHLMDNIQALKIKLTDEQIQYLESVKPFDVGFPSNFLGADPNVTGKVTPRLLRASQVAFPHAHK